MSLVENKKIFLQYEIKERFEAGIELTGNEVKAIRNSKSQIDGAKIIIRGGEAYIVGMNVSPYQISKNEENKKNAKNDRTRKLLLKKSEILKLATETEKGLQIVPIKIFDKHGLLKIEICLAKRKNKADKREAIKAKEFKREKKSIL